MKNNESIKLINLYTAKIECEYGDYKTKDEISCEDLDELKLKVKEFILKQIKMKSYVWSIELIENIQIIHKIGDGYNNLP